jgi:hypothetical protein
MVFAYISDIDSYRPSSLLTLTPGLFKLSRAHKQMDEKDEISGVMII